MPRLPSQVTSFSQIARFIREHTGSGGEIIFTAHSRKEMTNDQLNAVDVREALKACTVVRRELHGLDWRATCQGRTRLGEWIEVVVKVIDPIIREAAEIPEVRVQARLLVITVYRRKSR